MMTTTSNKKILILGSTGMIGSALTSSFQEKGAQIWGTTRDISTTSDRVFYLDILKVETIDAIPWSQFDCIVDCIGEINYTNEAAAAISVIHTNVLGPLSIISKLTSGQIYYHCSTHAVLLPPELQNSYSLSKLFLEKYSEKIATSQTSHIVSLRLPGVFSLERPRGLFHMIKTKFHTREQLTLSWNSHYWHPIFLPRLADIMSTLIGSHCVEPVVTIGYPHEISIEYLIENAVCAFGYSVPIEYSLYETDHYVPDITQQNKFLIVTKEDLESDLRIYFSTT